MQRIYVKPDFKYFSLQSARKTTCCLISALLKDCYVSSTWEFDSHDIHWIHWMHCKWLWIKVAAECKSKQPSIQYTLSVSMYGIIKLHGYQICNPVDLRWKLFEWHVLLCLVTRGLMLKELPVMHSKSEKPTERELKAAGIIYPPPKKLYCTMTQPTQYGTA